MSALHEYTEEFFEYIERGSIASAKRFSKLLVPMLNVNSILDVGCGRGAWLREWQAAGVATAVAATARAAMRANFFMSYSPLDSKHGGLVEVGQSGIRLSNPDRLRLRSTIWLPAC